MDIRCVRTLSEDEIYEMAKQHQVSVDQFRCVHEHGELSVVNLLPEGVEVPADAALMMQLGAEGVFIGFGIFKSGNPKK